MGFGLGHRVKFGLGDRVGVELNFWEGIGLGHRVRLGLSWL